jgi:oxalate decarboxylase/phosphoglucose isomerase-like protein (cupin superfamily)
MQRTAGRHLMAVVLCIGLVTGAAVSSANAALAGETSKPEPIVRTILAQAAPDNGPGQQLYLEEVTIAPGAKLATHRHEGTQIASIKSGVLTYNVISGTATVARADGSTDDVHGPATIRLRRGDAITESATLVHYGANKGSKPVVILVAALLTSGAPLATPVTEAGA